MHYIVRVCHILLIVSVDPMNAEESFTVDDWVLVDSIPTPPPPEVPITSQPNQEQSLFPEALDAPLTNDTHEEPLFNDDKYVNH